MHGCIKKWMTVLLCISMTVPVYAAPANIIPVAEQNELLTEDNSDIYVEDIIDMEDTDNDSITPVDEQEEEITNDGIGSIPSSFDPRKEAPWYITPIRDQKSYGSCWAHGVLAAAEANLLKNNIVPQYDNKTLNLSERVLNHISYNQDKYPNSYDPLHNSVGEYYKSSMSYEQPSYYDDGGTSWRSTSVLQNWLGVVNELDTEGNINHDTYYDDIPKSGIDNMDVKYISPLSGNIVAHMENAVYLDTKEKDVIKKYILKDGALLCSYYVDDDAYLGSDDLSYYVYEDVDSNHEVAIVGWDDNYKRYNFNYDEDNLPRHNGAWLLRNSWGSGFGDGGYFWLSYEDKSLNTIVAIEMAPEDNYDNNYHYAGAHTTSVNFDSNISIASVFKVKEEGGARQVLRAVSLAFDSYDIDYTVDIYKGSYAKLLENPIDESGSVSTAKGYFEYPGIYTIKLDDAVDLNVGDAFSVVIELNQKHGSKISLRVEKADKYTVVNQHRGEAYLDNNFSGILKDVSDPETNGEEALNFWINALTDRVNEGFDIEGVQNPADGTTYDPVSRTVKTVFSSDTTVSGDKIIPTKRFALKYTNGISANKVTLTTSDRNIVEVNSDGTLTATGAGRAFITAEYKNNGSVSAAKNISVVVRKEIKPGWFVYATDNDNYWPDNNEIFLYECSNYTIKGSDWVKYVKDRYEGTFTRLAADVYNLDYSGNRTATDSAKAEIWTPTGSFYYADDQTIEYSIGKCDVDSLDIYLKDGKWNKDKHYYEYEYTGRDISPDVTSVEYSDGTSVDFRFLGYKKLINAENDTWSAYLKSKPRDAGIYKAYIEVDDSLFDYDVIYQKFEICKQDITNAKVEYKVEYIYTGHAVIPEVTIRDKDDREIYTNQYSIEVKNNINAYDLTTQGLGDNAPYFTISAAESGNYENSVHVTDPWDEAHPERFYFSILPAELNASDKKGMARTQITLSQAAGRRLNDYAYTGSSIKPVISKVLYYDPKGENPVEIDPKYYDVSYENNVYPTDTGSRAYVIITGKGAYEGSVRTGFSITDDSQASVTDKVIITLKNPKNTSYEYTGKPIKPAVVVWLAQADGTAVRKLKNKEYNISYYRTDNPSDTKAVNAGTWGIAVTPANPSILKFKTSSNLRYTIKPMDARKIKITLSTSRIKQGKRTDKEYADYVAGGVSPGIKSVKAGRVTVPAESYSVSYINNTSCGIATAVFTFKGNYTGVGEVPYTITGRKISKLKFSRIADQTVEFDSYGNAVAICPEPGVDFTITGQKGEQVINSKGKTDKYVLSYCNNQGIGKAAVVISGRGIYEGTAVIPFEIVRRNISDKSIKAGNDSTGNDIREIELTGASVVPEKIKVIDTKGYWDPNSKEYKSLTLKENVDYTLKITGNDKPGTGTVTITGCGNYAGKTFRTFDIVDKRAYHDSKRDIRKLVNSNVLYLSSSASDISKMSLSDNRISGKLSRVYRGDPITFDDLSLEDASQSNSGKYTLQEGYDYIVKYSNNTDASADPSGRHIKKRKTPELVITGVGPNYTGTYSIPFEIKQLRLSTAKIKPLWDIKVPFAPVGRVPDIAYNGKAQKPVPNIYYLDDGYENSVYASKLLVKLNNNAFSIQYLNNKNISEAGAALILKPKKADNFRIEEDQSVTLKYSYGIIKGDLSKAVIGPVAQMSYKGRKVTPKPAVTLDGAKLKEGRDFVYDYFDNEGYGVGSVSIKPVNGKSNFELNGEAPRVYFVIK